MSDIHFAQLLDFLMVIMLVIGVLIGVAGHLILNEIKLLREDVLAATLPAREAKEK